MPLDYAKARQYFAEHLAAELNKDPEARGRIESAAFHTAQWIWEQGYNEGLNETEYLYGDTANVSAPVDWSYETIKLQPLARQLEENLNRRELGDAARAAAELKAAITNLQAWIDHGQR